MHTDSMLACTIFFCQQSQTQTSREGTGQVLVQICRSQSPRPAQKRCNMMMVRCIDTPMITREVASRNQLFRCVCTVGRFGVLTTVPPISFCITTEDVFQPTDCPVWDVEITDQCYSDCKRGETSIRSAYIVSLMSGFLPGRSPQRRADRRRHFANISRRE